MDMKKISSEHCLEGSGVVPSKKRKYNVSLHSSGKQLHQHPIGDTIGIKYNNIKRFHNTDQQLGDKSKKGGNS